MLSRFVRLFGDERSIGNFASDNMEVYPLCVDKCFWLFGCVLVFYRQVQGGEGLPIFYSWYSGYREDRENSGYRFN